MNDAAVLIRDNGPPDVAVSINGFEVPNLTHYSVSRDVDGPATVTVEFIALSVNAEPKAEEVATRV